MSEGRDQEAGMIHPSQCPGGPHRGPEGPNEDIAMCFACGSPSWSLRPENEQIGLHAADCSLPRRHEGYCVGGGDGHPPTEVVRGWWRGMDADVAAERARFTPAPQPPARDGGSRPHEHDWQVEYVPDPNSAGGVVRSGDLTCRCGATKEDA